VTEQKTASGNGLPATPPEVKNTSGETPDIIADADGPTFRIVGGGGDALKCESCGYVFVEGFLPGRLVGIKIRCGKCGAITSTPSLPDGDVFPSNTVIFGPNYPYLIKSTVTMSAGSITATEREKARTDSLTRPRDAPRDEPSFNSQTKLDAVAAELDSLSGGRFAPHLRSAEKAAAQKHPYFHRNPLAWALVLLRKKLKDGAAAQLDDDATVMALTTLYGYHRMLTRWRHHV
jgi:hypothetical protein